MTENAEQQNWPLIILRRKYFILVAALVCSAAALGASFILPKTYQSGLVLKVGRVSYFSTNPRAAKLDVTTSDIETVAAVQDLIKSEPFMAEVIDRLKLSTTPDKLVKKVKVKINMDAKPEEQNNQIIITTEARTSEKAVKLVSSIADLLIERHAKLYNQAMAVQYDYEAKLQKQIGVIEDDLLEMKATLNKLYKDPKVGTPAVLLLQAAVADKEKDLADFKRELSQANEIGHTNLKSENTSMVVPPYTPSRPSSPVPLVDAIAGLFLGGFVAAGYAVYRELFGNR